MPNPDWQVRVYEGSELVDAWAIYDRTERDARREVEAILEHNALGIHYDNWSLTEIPA